MIHVFIRPGKYGGFEVKIRERFAENDIRVEKFDCHYFSTHPDYILIYEKIGGQDTPSRGDIIRKIDVRNGEFLVSDKREE